MDIEVPQRGPGAAAKPQKLKKHCKLYILGKYFVRRTWCQNDEAVTLPAMLYKGEGRVTVKFSRRICALAH